MGEHVRGDVFRGGEISVQRAGGSAGCFVRDPVGHAAALRAFFARTGGEDTLFNYLREWHSHPTFEPVPSSVDVTTMQALIEAPTLGVNFLVLLIVTIDAARTIECSATVFSPQWPCTNATILSEQPESKVAVVRRLFGGVRDRRDREQE